MMPWSHLRHPFLGRMWTDLSSECTFLNFLIRLSIVQQLAFLFFTIVDVPLTLLSLDNRWFLYFLLTEAVPNNQKLHFCR